MRAANRVIPSVKTSQPTPTGEIVFVYSILANDNRFVEWIRGGDGAAHEGRSVLIRGGTGVANDRLVTPHGVMTQVSADLLPILENDETFKFFVQNGSIVVQRKKADIDTVVADMKARDESAPLTPGDYMLPRSGDALLAEAAKVRAA